MMSVVRGDRYPLVSVLNEQLWRSDMARELGLKMLIGLLNSVGLTCLHQNA